MSEDFLIDVFLKVIVCYASITGLMNGYKKGKEIWRKMKLGGKKR